MPDLTAHGKARLRSRMGIKRRHADDAVANALYYGVERRECAGELGRYMDTLYARPGSANYICFYDRAVYLFHDDVLITAYPLPEEHVAAAKRAQEARRVRLAAEEDVEEDVTTFADVWGEE